MDGYPGGSMPGDLFSDFTLTVLGAGPAVPNAGGASSGYLLRHRGQPVLVDCGSGVVGNLLRYLRAPELQGVAISHLHADHYFDFVPLYYGLKFGRRGPESPTRLPFYVPPGGQQHLRDLARLVGGTETMLDDQMAVREYAPDRTFDIGGLSFTFHPVQHYILSHAMRITASTGRTLVFSSDVGPCDALVEAARGADLFLCEAALLDPSDDPTPRRRGHMTAREAGLAARAAGAKRLVLTHLRSDGGELDRQQLEAARAAFGGPVELAREGVNLTV